MYTQTLQCIFHMVPEPGPQERIQHRIVEESVDELRRSSKPQNNSAANLEFISVALSGKSVDFSKIISMIDEMVILRERTRERIVDETSGIPIHRTRCRTTQWTRRSRRNSLK